MILPFAVTSRYDTFAAYSEFFIAHSSAVILSSFFACFGLLSASIGFFLAAQTVSDALTDPFRRGGLGPRLLSVSLTLAYFIIVSLRAFGLNRFTKAMNSRPGFRLPGAIIPL